MRDADGVADCEPVSSPPCLFYLLTSLPVTQTEKNTYARQGTRTGKCLTLFSCLFDRQLPSFHSGRPQGCASLLARLPGKFETSQSPHSYKMARWLLISQPPQASSPVRCQRRFAPRRSFAPPLSFRTKLLFSLFYSTRVPPTTTGIYYITRQTQRKPCRSRRR